MRAGSMRVSRDTNRPPTDRPRAALRVAGVDPRPRWTAPGLAQPLAAVQPGDGLLVWPLDHLDRSPSPLVPRGLTLQSQGVVFVL
jgi:DNA invertase Pin-like site-specific DNA recombinase